MVQEGPVVSGRVLRVPNSPEGSCRIQKGTERSEWLRMVLKGPAVYAGS